MNVNIAETLDDKMLDIKADYAVSYKFMKLSFSELY